jgi:peptide-methionine (S)-S-oxide reductase
MLMFSDKQKLISPEQALAGRKESMSVAERHSVLDAPLKEPADEYFQSRGLQQAMFALGCFWGAEKNFWSLPGIYTTGVGYAGGYTPNPTYEEVCSGRTGHTESVWLVFDPNKISYQTLLAEFWESHDPTQGMRQGNDRGTQYRSMILCYGEIQLESAKASRSHYQGMLSAKGYGEISTEIQQATTFYYAEDYHQQYLAKNPNGYCGLGGTGVCYDEAKVN